MNQACLPACFLPSVSSRTCLAGITPAQELTLVTDPPQKHDPQLLGIHITKNQSSTA